MERISLKKLQILILQKEDSYKTRALLGPIVHEFPDDYYNAAIQYLMNGAQEELIEGDITLKDIIRELNCSYLEALCILNNVRKNPQDVYYIMHYAEIL